MSRDHSDRINALFAAHSRDLTPAPARHAGRVLYVPFSPDSEVSRLCASVLSDSERQRAERFAAEHDKARFQQRRAFRRFCAAGALGSPKPLSQCEFEATEKGRPYLPELPDVWFSFSTCRFGLLGAWSSTHGIGVDLEDTSRDLEASELARRFFSQAEANAVVSATGPVRLRTFLQFWTLKEAALKSIGEGLPFGLDAFEFVLTPSPRVVRAPPDHGRAAHFDARILQGTEGCAALVIRNPG